MRRPSVLLVIALPAVAAVGPAVGARPISGPWPAAFPAKDLCSVRAPPTRPTALSLGVDESRVF